MSISIICSSPWLFLSHCKVISSNFICALTSLGAQPLPVPRGHSSLGSDNNRCPTVQGSRMVLRSREPESILKPPRSCELTFLSCTKELQHSLIANQNLWERSAGLCLHTNEVRKRSHIHNRSHEIEQVSSWGPWRVRENNSKEWDLGVLDGYNFYSPLQIFVPIKSSYSWSSLLDMMIIKELHV